MARGHEHHGSTEIGRHHGHSHDHSHDHNHELDHDRLQECIEECLQCHAVCAMTVQHCLVKGHELADVDIVSVLLDCAEICQTNANFMLRGSPYHALTCTTCAAVCQVCAEACASFDDDEQLAHCAEVCASCSESCEQMAAMLEGEDGEGEEEEIERGD